VNLKTTLTALRTGWHLLVIGTVIAAMAAVALNRTATLVYEATASYVVSPGADVADDDVARGVDTLDSSRSRSIMATLTQIAASDAVLTDAFSALNVDPELSGSYTVKSIVVPEANVMETIVTGPSPQLAAALASTIGEIGGARFVDLYRIYDVQVLDDATIPTAPSNTGLSQMLVVAVALGLMAGAGAALLRSAWSERSKQTMRSRLGAYDPAVTSIEEHNRFQRAG